MTSSIAQPQYNEIERRELAQHEIINHAGIGKLMYLMHSPHVRKVPLQGDLVAHSAVDVINVLVDSTRDPRKTWTDVKKRMLKHDPNMSAKIGHIPFPLWNDRKGRSRGSDYLTSAGLVILVFELHSEYSNLIRHSIAEMFDQFDRQHHDAIIAELEHTSGWAGTRIRLLMAKDEEPGDYDLPNGEWWQK
jgi:hypothetical protein